MDFFNQTGKLAIGSRLRMLTDKITVDAAAIYKMFGVDLKPKWFPVFFVLSRGEAKTITSIAKEIGHVICQRKKNVRLFFGTVYRCYGSY